MATKHQFFLKLDISFHAPEAVASLMFMPNLYHQGVDGNYSVRMETRGDTEDECVEAAFEAATKLRDALIAFLADRRDD